MLCPPKASILIVYSSLKKALCVAIAVCNTHTSVFVSVSFIHQNKSSVQDDCMQTSEITNDGGNRDVLRRLIRIGL